MLSSRVAERRQSVRAAGAHPVSLFDSRDNLLGSGRTVNISAGGLFAIFDTTESFEVNSRVVVQMTLPAMPGSLRPDKPRLVSYTARVANVRHVGQLLGLGLELLSKVQRRPKQTSFDGGRLSKPIQAA
jgi:c-di-GMP-binding flagellar brake protein YcgR